MIKSITSAAIPADIGIVRSHAQTIRVATPQRTAEARLIEPTPTIAPVIVWVVETGMPEERGAEQRDRPGRLSRESVHRAELREFAFPSS